ncbi:VOC family protein [Streptosporangiaceae bacterium NEAU-GS5]|nr:VOC family protein [Streptosporangiaceae bacterium NEAU-GS5]
MSALGIDNVLIGVGDLAGARRFYGGTLGLKEKFATADMILYAVGDETPGILVRVTGDPKPGAMRVWLEVPDARALGLDAEPFEIFTGWTVELSDPWGSIIGLTDYTKRPELGRHASPGELG